MHRIVARVAQLMSLCDELEAGLLRSQAASEGVDGGGCGEDAGRVAVN